MAQSGSPGGSIPPEQGVGNGSSRWLTIVGVGLWAVVLVAFGLLVFTDIGGSETGSVVVLIGATVVAATVILVLSVTLYMVFERLNLGGGAITLLVALIATVVVPVGVLFLLSQLGGGGGASLLDGLIDSLPVSDNLRRTAGPVLEGLLGG
jgi:hypothetical protein